MNSNWEAWNDYAAHPACTCHDTAVFGHTVCAEAPHPFVKAHAHRWIKIYSCFAYETYQCRCGASKCQRSDHYPPSTRSLESRDDAGM